MPQNPFARLSLVTLLLAGVLLPSAPSSGQGTKDGGSSNN